MHTEKGLVSILICTYNAENTIKNTIDSCLKQTYKNFEILIHDDQSKDKTIEVIKNIGDNRIKIIESGKKLGPYGGLNFLLDNSKGEYIAIQDHDDLWTSDKLNKQVNFLNKNNKYIGCGSGQIEYYSIQRTGIITNIKGGDTNFVPHTSLIFRNGTYRYDQENDFLGDAFFEIKQLTKGKKIIYSLPEILILHYNKESGGNYSDQWFKINKKNTKRFIDIYGNNLHMIGIYLFFSFFYFVGGKKLKNIIEKSILKIIHKKYSFDELYNYNNNTKELMQYYK